MNIINNRRRTTVTISKTLNLLKCLNLYLTPWWSSPSSDNFCISRLRERRTRKLKKRLNWTTELTLDNSRQLAAHWRMDQLHVTQFHVQQSMDAFFNLIKKALGQSLSGILSAVYSGTLNWTYYVAIFTITCIWGMGWNTIINRKSSKIAQNLTIDWDSEHPIQTFYIFLYMNTQI